MSYKATPCIRQCVVTKSGTVEVNLFPVTVFSGHHVFVQDVQLSDDISNTDVSVLCFDVIVGDWV